jgi:hypothetical protein
MRVVTLIIATLAFAALPAIAAASSAANHEMTTPRSWHTATHLEDGRVLLAGGETGDGTTLTAEVFDPLDSTFSETDLSQAPRSMHVAVRLPDGRVLLVGGFDVDPEAIEDEGGAEWPWAEAWDPDTGMFSEADVPIPVNSHVAALTDGRLLFAERTSEGLLVTSYDPTTGALGVPATARIDQYGVVGSVLAEGRVLVIPTVTNMDESWPAWLYDPRSGALDPAGPSAPARPGPVGTALHDGRVLLLGFDAAQLYDPSDGSFVVLDAPAGFQLTALPVTLTDGRVLVLGQDADGWPAARLFDLGTGTFAPTGTPAADRVAAPLTVLADGRVLVTGGAVPLCDGARSSAEIYDPATGTFTSTSPLAPSSEPTVGPCEPCCG